MSYIASAFPRFAEHMEPHEVVFQLAKSGKLRQLKQYLNRRTKEERKRIISCKYNGATSLIMACRNGHYEVVEYVVENCSANLEQSGLVNFEGENIEGAPPLWCSAAAGHLKIVKYLVSKGANVNSTTKSNSTALRAACFDGHFEIVKFLVENSADIEIANRHGHTCLMIACYKGHLQIAKYLISKGADLNRKSVKGNTALHDCAECGSLEIMKLLLSHNAKMAADSYNMTPLLAAAVTGHSAIVEYLLTRAECTPLEKVHALELLGATYVDKKHDMMSAYGYWKSALERRITHKDSSEATADSLNKSLNIKHSPIEAYDYATEFITQNELDEIIADPDDMRMQALLIRERILGPTHPDTTYYIRYRGAVYADCGNFRKCILLWLYALDTQQKCLEPLHPMIQSSFLSFTELFQYMQKQLAPFNTNSALSVSASNASAGREAGALSSQNYSLTEKNSMFNILNMYTTTVYKILQQAVEEIKRGLNLLQLQNEELQQQQKKFKSLNTTSSSESISSSYSLEQTDLSPSDKPLKEIATEEEGAKAISETSNATTNKTPSTPTIAFDMSHFDRTLVVIVHFLIVVAESLKHCSPEETFKLKKLVYELVKLNPKNSKNSTLLHLASCGVRETILFLVKNKMIDAIVTTCGGIEEDFMKCMAPAYMGKFEYDGIMLRQNGLNRIGNMVVPNDNYRLFEDWLLELLDRMLVEQKEQNVNWTPSKLINRMGKEINNEESVWYWCYKNNIPVFCPAITDGGIGDTLFYHSFKNPGLKLDLVEDIQRMDLLTLFAVNTGSIILGGGTSKHHILNANCMRNGTNYSVFVNTGQEFDGSDSGAKPDEALSWAKIRPEASPVKVYGEASLIFPLLVSQTFAKNFPVNN